jgi:hypothetical protein
VGPRGVGFRGGASTRDGAGGLGCGRVALGWRRLEGGGQGFSRRCSGVFFTGKITA